MPGRNSCSCGGCGPCDICSTPADPDTVTVCIAKPINKCFVLGRLSKCLWRTQFNLPCNNNKAYYIGIELYVAGGHLWVELSIVPVVQVGCDYFLIIKKYLGALETIDCSTLSLTSGGWVFVDGQNGTCEGSDCTGGTDATGLFPPGTAVVWGRPTYSMPYGPPCCQIPDGMVTLTVGCGENHGCTDGLECNGLNGAYGPVPVFGGGFFNGTSGGTVTRCGMVSWTTSFSAFPVLGECGRVIVETDMGVFEVPIIAGDIKCEGTHSESFDCGDGIGGPACDCFLTGKVF